jgi:D-galactarolactone cycloisomerase
MYRIRDIRVIPLQFALDGSSAYGSARGLTSRRGGSIVLLQTEDGIEGIGEAWGPGAVALAYLDIVKPHYIGASVHAVRGVAQSILARMYHMGTQNQLFSLLGGIDIAAHDAIGKMVNLSVAELIGGRLRERVPVYASGGYFTEGADHEAALARQLEPLGNKGYGAYKIKIGRRPDEDETRVALARRIIGEAPLLTVDANGNYTVDAVLESMRRIAPFGIHWYEEPLTPQDWAGYAELRQRTPIPLATGEALYGLFDLRRVIDNRLAAVVQPDLTLCGGFDVGRTVGVLCAAEHLRISPHCWGTGVGLAAALQFVASLPGYPHGANVPFPTLLEYDVGQNALRDEIFVEPLHYADGCLKVPKGPGLGVTLDAAALRRFTVTQ